MSAVSKLFKNTVIFAISNFGSKILSIILVPFYTYNLTTQEYGSVDLISTTVMLLVPVVTLYIQDATMRFTMDTDFDNKTVLTNTIIIQFINYSLIFLVSPIALLFISYDFILVVFLIIVFQGLYLSLGQYVKAKGSIIIFAGSGLINTIVLLISNIVLLSSFHLGIQGYLISMLLSYIIATGFIVFSGKIWKDFSFKYYNRQILKVMVRYSAPLIPNSVMWWIINMSDRYVILIFIGTAANGIFAVANKIPSLINMLSSIFLQAWQITVIEEKDTSKKGKFFSDTFQGFYIIQFLLVSFLLIIIKPAINLIIEESYRGAVYFIPFLLLAAVFSGFSAFLGTFYAMAKETKGAMFTTLISGGVNILLNLLLIWFFSTNGIAIATMISFLLLWILRIKGTKRFVSLQYNYKLMAGCFLIILIQIVLFYMSLKLEIFLQTVLFIILLILGRKFIILMIKKAVFKVISKKKGKI